MNKRLTILFSLLSVAILLVVLFCTVFLVRSIEVVGTQGYEPNDSKVLEDSLLATGINIFSVSENKVTENIEAKNPYLKVVLVERKFPDKVIIHVTERTEQFFMRVSGDKYAILDRELKILNVIDSVSAELTEIKGHIPEGLTTESAGAFLSRSDSKYNALRDVVTGYEALTLHGFKIHRFNAFITNVELSTDAKTILTTVDGVKIEIIGTQNIDKQVEYSYSFYINELTDAQRTSGVITNSGEGWYYKP